MSLVVGEIHDGRISLVADTKVTYAGDDRSTRHVFENAFPKLLILRDDLCVGLAGNDPEGVAESLLAVRSGPLEQVLVIAEALVHASFVVASLGPAPRLLQVDQGSTQDRTEIGRAWVGDVSAYEVFQQRYSEWPPGIEVPFLLISSLQWLLSFGTVSSVGGYLTNVGSGAGGFRYVPQVTHIGPEELAGLADVVDDRLQLHLAVPAGGDTSSASLLCAVGTPPTVGALAYVLAPAGVGLLFPHDAPHQPIVMKVASIDELIERAASDHGQQLIA